jgi:hypothetical protein
MGRPRGPKVARLEDGRLQRVFHSETSLLPHGEGPRIELEFAEVDGRFVCARVVIGVDFENAEEPDPVPITTGVLRAIPLSTLIENAVQKSIDLFEMVDRQNWNTAPTARKRLPAARRATERPKRTGRPTLYDRKHYKRVAAIYDAAVRAGSRAPTKAVAENYRVSKSAAAKWVARARQMGLIPAAS